MYPRSIFVAATLASTVSASPSPEPNIISDILSLFNPGKTATNTATATTAAVSATGTPWTVYTVPHTDGADDSPALRAALAVTAATANGTNPVLTTNATILFQKGVIYNIWSPVKFPTLTNVDVSIQGNLSYPATIAEVQAGVTNTKIYGGAWFTFSAGTNVTLEGSTDPKWGWIDGHGQQWWDEVNQTNRPHGWAFSHIKGGVIRNMKLWKPVAWNFATSGSDSVHAYNNQIYAISDSSAFPFNTDGFSAGGTNMVFENNHIVNGDDCLTVGSGAINITFRNSYCEGGHGLSIGSLGSGGAVANVQNIWIENVAMKDTLYGARFKSWTGGNGLARNVTWKDIAFNNVMFPIYVTQNYWDQGKGAKPNSTSTNETHIADFTFQNFAGSIRDTGYVEGSCVTDPCWYAVTNATGHEVIIFDLYEGTASNIVAKDIFAVTDSGKPVAVLCDPSTISNDVGFKCWDGKFERTAAGW